jgi:hypothetical protein
MSSKSKEGLADMLIPEPNLRRSLHALSPAPSHELVVLSFEEIMVAIPRASKRIGLGFIFVISASR